MNLAKFLRTSILKNICERLLLQMVLKYSKIRSFVSACFIWNSLLRWRRPAPYSRIQFLIHRFEKSIFFHLDIPFSLEKEKDGRLSFLDINIFREKGKLVTNVYRKKPFSSVYTNFNSFIPETYRTGLIESLLFRCLNLCSDFVKFHHEINILKSILPTWLR